MVILAWNIWLPIPAVDFGYAVIPIKDQLVEAQISLLFLKVRPRIWMLGQSCTEALYQAHTGGRFVQTYVRL